MKQFELWQDMNRYIVSSDWLFGYPFLSLPSFFVCLFVCKDPFPRRNRAEMNSFAHRIILTFALIVYKLSEIAFRFQ